MKNFKVTNSLHIGLACTKMSIRQIAFFLLFAGIVVGAKASTLNVRGVSKEMDKSAQVIPVEPLSEDYEVWINGKKTVVYIARVQDAPWAKATTKLDFGGNYSFTSFDISGPVVVKIRSLKKSFLNTILRPEKSQVEQFVKSENEISFKIDKPIKLSIEPDGKNAPLLLFANPINDFVPDKSDKNVIYFGPGIHRPDSALVRVRDNQILYLAEGAIVKAGVILSGNNAKICGRGILDGNEFVWGKGARHMVDITGNNVVVKDIIIRGGADWTMPVRNCHNVVIDNVKILGGRAQNDDGINPCNAQDVWIKNCFIRTDDDCIALKGMLDPPNSKNVERIKVENSILWSDRARVFLLGHESRAEYMRDIVFKNIDIIHFAMTAFLLEPGEDMKMQNVLFENFTINGEGQKELIRLKPTINQYMHTMIPGHINNITFKNIVVTGKIAGDYSIELAGADENHAVSGVNMSGISILGNKIKTGVKNLKIGSYVYKVSIK